MKPQRALAILAVLLCCSPVASSAQTGSGLGQSFFAPTSDPFLESINSGTLNGNGSSFVYTAFVYEMSAAGALIGSPVFQQSIFGVTGQNRIFTIDQLLTPGARHA